MANSPRYVGFIDPPYVVTLTDDTGAAINLTGCTSNSFTLTMLNQNSSLSQQGAGVWTITDAVNGKVSYQWTSADMATAGTWQVYTTVKLPSEPSPREFDPDPIVILPGTVGAGAAPAGVLPAPIAQALFFNGRDYGARGDGSTDDTASIQAAMNAAGTAGGGIVFLPQGTYKTSASLVFNADNILLWGSGWQTIIKPATGAQFDVISTPIPASAGLSGFTRNYIGVRDLMIDCSNMTGTTAGIGNGIHLYGTRYSHFYNLYIIRCPNWAIISDGDNTGPGNNFGYDNVFFKCVFDLNNANLWTTNSEANDIVDCRFKWCGAATAASQPAFPGQDTNSYHIRNSGGYMYIAGNILGKGGSYTTPAILCSNSGPCRIVGNRFDQVRNQAITLNGGNHMFAFNQLGSPGSAISGVPGIQIGSSKNTVVGNKFDVSAGAINATYCIAESGGPFSDNIIADNNLLTGTSGFINLNSSSTDKVHHNAGYNPVGQVTAPSFPATTVAATNNTGVDVTAYIANGTAAITVVQVAGQSGSYVTTGYQIAASGWGSVRIPAGGSVKFTYASGTPTWTWFGD